MDTQQKGDDLQPVAYTLRQMAVLLGTTEEAIRMSIARGGQNLPPRIKLGNKWLFPRRLADQWVRDLEARAVALSTPRRGPGRPRKVPTAGRWPAQRAAPHTAGPFHPNPEADSGPSP